MGFVNIRTSGVLAAVGVVVAAVLAVPVPAAAHEGEVVFSGERGPYQLQATDRVVEATDGAGDQAILYSLSVRRAGSGLPVDGAEVSVTFSSGEVTEGPFEANNFGNQYFVTVPAAGVSSWQVAADIDAGPGTASLTHQVRGTAATPAWVAPVVVGASVAGVLVIAALAWWLVRRRRRADPGLSEPAPAGSP